MTEHRTNTRPAVLRRLSNEEGMARPGRPVSPQNATGREIPAAGGRLALSSLTTAALVGLGLAAVETSRIALVHEALGGFFGNTAGTLPFASVLTLGLAALDGGLLLRLFAPTQRAAIALDVLPMLEEEARERQVTSTGGAFPQLREKIPQAESGKARDHAGAFADWCNAGAWLLVTTANSILCMYALASAMPQGHELADAAPAAVAIVLLVLRLLLVGALAAGKGYTHARGD